MGALGLYLGDRDVAEELAQETLVRVCEHWSEVGVMASPADLPVSEVASAMGCPGNTVKTHTRRGIAALREAGLIDANTSSEVLDAG